MIYPKQKTEVVPIFTGTQGTGKSTFGEIICKALFGSRNVLVTPSFDGTSRFNSDQADALIICIEEKQQNDNKNTTSLLKSLSTTSTVRKEHKGVDPFYQVSYTEYVLTTNEVVPIKFDSRKQRRFMVMEADKNFVRKRHGDRETDTSILADEVFERLYGTDRNGEQTGLPLTQQLDTIQQFKYELLRKKDLPNCRDFLETESFKKCFEIPRTIEMIEIEATVKSLLPFVLAMLKTGKALNTINLAVDDEPDQIVNLSDVTPYEDGVQYVNHKSHLPNRVAINRMLLFRNDRDLPYSHASVDRCLYDMQDYLLDQGLRVLGTTDPPTNGGFRNCAAKYRYSPTLWFVLEDSFVPKDIPVVRSLAQRLKTPDIDAKAKARFNDKFQPDPLGCFEVLNPLRPNTSRASSNVLSETYFLLEADETTDDILAIEQGRLETCGETIRAEDLYAERLKVQHVEAMRLLNAGIVQRIVYSGAKSLHMLVEVEQPPKTKEERRWLDAYLKTTLSPRLVFDFTTSDPARLTRAPATFERKTTINGVIVIGEQKIIREKKENIYRLNWRPLYNQWLNNKRAFYEISLRKMLPTKTIYKDAAIALLNGSFWTDRKWNGQRNTTFFAAYRLIRSMGHTAMEFWLSMADDIKGYYKPEEIGYWLSRKDCALVQSIEQEID